MDYSPPDSSVNGIFQARILEWVAFLLSIFFLVYCNFFGWGRLVVKEWAVLKKIKIYRAKIVRKKAESLHSLTMSLRGELNARV